MSPRLKSFLRYLCLNCVGLFALLAILIWCSPPEYGLGSPNGVIAFSEMLGVLFSYLLLLAFTFPFCLLAFWWHSPFVPPLVMLGAATLWAWVLSRRQSAKA